MHIQSFTVFSNLAETSSFSKAAQMNGITQSAVSQQVRALERRFSVKLIERGRKNFSLTPEGREFLQASHQVMDILGDLEGRINNLQNLVAGELVHFDDFQHRTARVAAVFEGFQAGTPGSGRSRRVSPLFGGLLECVGWPSRHWFGCISIYPQGHQGDDVLE